MGGVAEAFIVEARGQRSPDGNSDLSVGPAPSLPEGFSCRLAPSSESAIMGPRSRDACHKMTLPAVRGEKAALPAWHESCGPAPPGGAG